MAEAVPAPCVVNFRSFLEPTLKSRVRNLWAARIGLFSFFIALNAFIIAYSGFLLLDVSLPLVCAGLLYMLGLMETPFIPVGLTLGDRSVTVTLYNGQARKLRVSGRLGGFSVMDCTRVVWRSETKSVPGYLVYGSDWAPISNEVLDLIKEEAPTHGFSVSNSQVVPRLAGEKSPSALRGNAVRYNVRAT